MLFSSYDCQFPNSYSDLQRHDFRNLAKPSSPPEIIDRMFCGLNQGDTSFVKWYSGNSHLPPTLTSLIVTDYVKPQKMGGRNTPQNKDGYGLNSRN